MGFFTLLKNCLYYLSVTDKNLSARSGMESPTLARAITPNGTTVLNIAAVSSGLLFPMITGFLSTANPKTSKTFTNYALSANATIPVSSLLLRSVFG